MPSNAKVEAIAINGKHIAVRISFTHDEKFYARQYAITDGMTIEQATKQCYKYRQRVTSRKQDSDLNVKAARVAQQLEENFVAIRRKHDAIVEQVGKDVAYVLQRFANDKIVYEYENVYGKQTEKKAPSYF